jgi:glutaredoxin-dependent peroxiredoxin
MPIQVGQEAPDFVLTDSTLKKIHLQELRGQNVVLLFFPLAFTRVCTAELCSVRDDLSIYQGLQSQVFGISADSPFVLAKFKEEQSLPFPLLSDFNKEVSAAYDSLYADYFGMKGVPKRSAFVIDAAGVVRYAVVMENDGEMPNFGAIQEVLKALH